MTEFTFIRPDALWLLIVVALYMLWRLTGSKRQPSNSQLIAPHLATQVLSQGQQKRAPSHVLSTLLMALMVVAIAGPSFSKKEVPVYQSKMARVLVMDMSRSMYSTDIAPSRLQQARYKALDMVDLFTEGETALVAYANDAYTISPLTSDSQTLTNLIPSLSPDIMPGQGSNVLAGLTQAQELLSQAGYARGDVILLSDGIDADEEADVRDWLASHDYRLHIYAIGTAEGAPINLPDGGFLKDQYGQIVIPTTDFSRLQRLAQAGNGKLLRYQASAANLSVLQSTEQPQQELQQDNKQTLWRIDAGIYLTLLIVPLMLWLMGRRALVLCAFMVLLPQPKAYAAQWQSWFNNEQQNALSAYQNEAYDQASQTENPLIAGAAKYQQQDYQGALDAFASDNSAQGLYNQGNALAQLGQLDEAIERYQQALEKNPELESAARNKALVEQMRQQQQQESQQGNNEQDSSQNKQQTEQDNDNQQQGEQQQSQQGQQQSADQRNDANNNDPQNSAQANDESSGQQPTESESKQSDSEQSQQQQQRQNGEQQQGDKAQNAEQQQQAQQMQQQQGDQQGTEQQLAAQASELTPEERERAQQLNQLLRKIPDDPEILLRNKMQLESRKRQRYRRLPQGVEKSW
ncbi:VWA domain-containing protein [Pseudoalteromonas sp. CNC9-20]|uniref:VWA domain-containing protein n=1 Tax=Pseudoalteromonas sp. CNC9-20 TaxID=2917750 RepID=UPI001EF5F052|nr:VWA domain-containing protein [Pseudoalteromonas sp. CNC9-20]MCG7571021.1 VWA domain-containing protein [Pseudoalteromonas sp. CNC9-20]